MKIHIDTMSSQKEGWLLIDKPSHMTSFDVVKKIRKIFDIQQIGHAGTLDPLATGLLPVALQKATKTIPFIVDAMKEYHFTIIWGEERDTDDASGNVTHVSTMIPDRNSIQQALPFFRGNISQIPPLYSAIKTNGMRSYTRARQGETWEMESRNIYIKTLEYTENNVFRVECSKGTYIRSLARDIARHLKSRGCVGSLRRTKVGGWNIKDAQKLENITLASPILSMDNALKTLPLIRLSREEMIEYYHGRKIKKMDDLYAHGSFCSLASEENIIFAIGKITYNNLYSYRRLKEIALVLE